MISRSVRSRRRMDSRPGPAESPPRLGPLSLELSPEQIGDVVDLVADEVELFRETLDLGLGAAVDVEVHFAADAVLLVLSVLAHHDDGRLDRREHGEEEVQED